MKRASLNKYPGAHENDDIRVLRLPDTQASDIFRTNHFRMKKEDGFLTANQVSSKNNPILRSLKSGLASKTGKRMKQIIFIGSMAGMGLFLNSCAAGYVATEPTYAEYSRPQRPSDLYVWVDGNWVYNRSSRGYVQERGNWQKPQPNRVYQKGYWQSGPKGKSWKKGYWQKKGREENRHNRY